MPPKAPAAKRAKTTPTPPVTAPAPAPQQAAAPRSANAPGPPPSHLLRLARQHLPADQVWGIIEASIFPLLDHLPQSHTRPVSDMLGAALNARQAAARKVEEDKKSDEDWMKVLRRKEFTEDLAGGIANLTYRERDDDRRGMRDYYDSAEEESEDEYGDEDKSDEQTQLGETMHKWLQYLLPLALERRSALGPIATCLADIESAIDEANDEDQRLQSRLSDILQPMALKSSTGAVLYEDVLISGSEEKVLTNRFRRDVMLAMACSPAPDTSLLKKMAKNLSLRGVKKPWEGEPWYPADFKATLPRLIAFLRAFEAEGVPTGFMGTHEMLRDNLRLPLAASAAPPAAGATKRKAKK